MIEQTHTRQADGSNLFQMVEDGVVVHEWVTPGPTNTWECDCGATLERYRGGGDQQCECGQWFNAGGQRLRSNWMGNPSTWDDDMGDLEGYEAQHADW